MFNKEYQEKVLAADKKLDSFFEGDVEEGEEEGNTSFFYLFDSNRFPFFHFKCLLSVQIMLLKLKS